jgi:hypothetical protein
LRDSDKSWHLSTAEIQCATYVLTSLRGLGDIAVRIGAGIGPKSGGKTVAMELLLSDVVERVRLLPIGLPLLLPGGWFGEAKENTHVVYIVERTVDDTYTFSIVNTNGVPYHLEAYRSDGSWYGHVLASRTASAKIKSRNERFDFISVCFERKNDNRVGVKLR